MNLPDLPSLPAAGLDAAGVAELDALLADAPPPLQPLDLAAIDGFLCAAIVQPRLVAPEEWLPWVLDVDGRSTDAAGAADWRARAEVLLRRHNDWLRRSIAEDGGFEPLVFDFDDAHPIAVSEYEPLSALPPTSQMLAPWVAGFYAGLERFPELEALGDADIDAAVMRLGRHLPPETPPAERPSYDPEQPLAGLDEALDELVSIVVDLHDRTLDARYRVDPLRRAEPKVGRNDPCPCGSGRKFKRCHGAG